MFGFEGDIATNFGFFMPRIPMISLCICLVAVAVRHIMPSVKLLTSQFPTKFSEISHPCKYGCKKLTKWQKILPLFYSVCLIYYNFS